VGPAVLAVLLIIGLRSAFVSDPQRALFHGTKKNIYSSIGPGFHAFFYFPVGFVFANAQ
jgi:hypothetical protein